MAENAEGRSLGSSTRISLLLRLLLESTHGCALPHRFWSRGCFPPPHADASFPVPTRRILGAYHQQTTDVSPRAAISPRRLVLFSSCPGSEIPTGISGLIGSFVNRRAKPPVAWSHRRSSASDRHTSALAGPLGELACVYWRVHAEPTRYQHPAFQRAVDFADPV